MGEEDGLEGHFSLRACLVGARMVFNLIQKEFLWGGGGGGFEKLSKYLDQIRPNFQRSLVMCHR